MNRWLNGQIDDGCMNGWIDGLWMYGFMDKLMGWWVARLMDEGCGWMNDSWMMDGLLNYGRMDEWKMVG